jgi:Domain of unknown function (DUF5658)
VPRTVVQSPRERWRQELAGRSTWKRPSSQRLVDLGAAVAIAAAVLDALITYVVLHRTLQFEANPIVASVMARIGIGPTLTLGALLRIGIVGALAYIASRAVRLPVRAVAAATLVGVAVWWTIVVFSNAAVVAHT